MINRQGLEQILHFVSKRWVDITRESDNKAMKSLPTNFWMNSIGGKAGEGRWITTLMYTESEDDANALKEVLLRWQAKGLQNKPSSDLIKIGKK